MNEMTIDMEEIYLAVLQRNCKLEILDKKSEDNIDTYYIKITEDNGVHYTVTLSSDCHWRWTNA